MSDKTEPPTPKKLREAREKGEVAKSKDLVQGLLFVVIFAILLGNNQANMRTLGTLIVLPGDFYAMPFLVSVREVGTMAINAAFAVMLPLIGAVMLTAIAGNMVQTGVLLAFKALKPNLNKLNPGAQLKNMFSVKTLIEFVKNVVKIAILAIILYGVLKAGLRDLLLSATCGLGCVLGVGSKMLIQILSYAAAVFLIIAAFDYFLQYQQHMKGLKMSKDEIKREYKEMEGDPHIKSKRKQFHHELMMEDTSQRVRKSSVLVTNPTEIAVAILYDAEETPLPLVLAKGEGYLAQRMIAIAREEGIPIMQNVPLARSLHSEAPVDQYIPSSLIEPVAEVLRWVQSLQENG
ncbi:MAG TPA: type III secretion system export apparatus subunit SctU [Reyranella sp.]|nr:type III secretion system export apparatus subunit SctU [Reyranella sp.]